MRVNEWRSDETINSENYNIMSWGRVRTIMSVIIFGQESIILSLWKHINFPTVILQPTFVV